MHDELDQLVADAYGWSWPEPSALILERLVALHDQRALDERVGTVRWLRPEYQRARFGQQADAPLEGSLELGDTATAPPAPAATAMLPWPTDAIGQISALRAMAATTPVTTEAAARQFTGARRDIVSRHVETLALLGEVERDEGGRYRLAAGALTAV